MGMQTLVQQYDALSAKQHDRDILLGVLLRLCPDNIRQHLTLSISDASSYNEVRERILAYERSSRLWSVEDMIKPLNRAGQGTQDTSGPMEVDAVTNKGKGWKGEKGGKGKKGGEGKGDWSSFWSWSNSWSKAARKAKVRRERANRRGKGSRKASRRERERKEKFIRIGAGYVVSLDIGATNVHSNKESEKFVLRLVRLQVRMVE